MNRLSRTSNTVLTVLATVVFAAAVVVALASRAPAPRNDITAAGASAQPVKSSLPVANEGMDPFAGYCVTESDMTLRAFTTEELRAYDARAKARGSAGWLIDGEPFAVGQGWVGKLPDAARAFGGVDFDRADRPGDWILLEREGKPMAMSLRSVELPSGTLLWLPHNFTMVAECSA